MSTRPLKLVYITPSIHTADGAARVLTLKANYFAEHYGYDIKPKGNRSFIMYQTKSKSSIMI